MKAFHRYFERFIIWGIAAFVLAGCDTESNNYNITVKQRSAPEVMQPQSSSEEPTQDAKKVEDQTSRLQSRVVNEPKIWPISSDENIDFSDDFMAENYYIVLDASGSMAKYVPTGNGSEKRIQVAKDAIQTFVKGLPSDVNLGLLTFEPTRELVELGPDNHQQVLKYTRRIVPTGRTPLYNSIKRGSRALETQARRQSGYGTYKLIIVTDGRSTDGDPSSLAREIVSNSPIEIHVIGFALKTHSLDIPGVTQYVTANSTEELIQALTDVTKSEIENFDVSEFN